MSCCRGGGLGGRGEAGPGVTAGGGSTNAGRQSARMRLLSQESVQSATGRLATEAKLRMRQAGRPALTRRSFIRKVCGLKVSGTSAQGMGCQMDRSCGRRARRKAEM